MELKRTLLNNATRIIISIIILYITATECEKVLKRESRQSKELVINLKNLETGEPYQIHREEDSPKYYRYQVNNEQFKVENGYLYKTVEEIPQDDSEFTVSVVNLKNDMTDHIHVRLVRQSGNWAPLFATPDYLTAVFETASPGTSIVRVQATDGDGDKLTYKFKDQSPQSYKMFRLNPSTGEIKLQSGPFEFLNSNYTLHVIADDGRGGKAEATVKVEVLFINSFTPEFKDCSNYHPSVKENEHPNTPVIQVLAVDEDKGKDGEVTYSIVRPASDTHYFKIDQNSGLITTTTPFDRDEPINQKWFDVTVKATDQGNIPRDSVCTIRIDVEDVNDNKPDFGRSGTYEADVIVGKEEGYRVVRIQANDMDAGDNGVISYTMLSETEAPGSELLRINPDNGIIILNRDVTENMIGQLNYIVNASDHGNPPLFETIPLLINIVSSGKNPPEIRNFPTGFITLSESTTDFTTPVASFQVKSNTESSNVLVTLVPGTTEQTNKGDIFSFKKGSPNSQGWVDVDIYLTQALDYEKIKKYWITIEVKNTEDLKATVVLTVQVEDANDQAPVFAPVEKATILENGTSGSVVLTVKASDLDTVPRFREITYELPDPDQQQLFSINHITGELKTLKTFDYDAGEEKFFVSILAKDGAVSSLGTGIPNEKTLDVEVHIQDINDNPPSFTRSHYNGSISEAADVNQLVIKVEAVDVDASSRLVYSIDRQGPTEGFKIDPTTGEIMVAQDLDYEAISHYPVYELTVGVTDGEWRATCFVHITIENANDMAPVFSQDFYVASEVQENKTDHLPKYLLQVSAIDPDLPSHVEQNVIYYLDPTSSSANHFRIGKHDGRLELIKALDFDLPLGRPKWEIRVFARDEGGDGIQNATVVEIPVTDVNDNEPYIKTPGPFYVIEVDGERRDPTVIQQNITFTVKDNDGPRNGPPFQVRIDPSAPEMADIFELKTNEDDVNNKLREQDVQLTTQYSFDRETQKEYLIPVVIVDSGTVPPQPGYSPIQTGTSTLTVVVRDINDNPMSDGKSAVTVFNFEGNLPDADIGRVYVTDADDWDLPDKRFYWRGPAPLEFKLNQDTGMVTMLAGTPIREYTLHFKVDDFTRNETAVSSMNVNIKLITEEAVRKSASIRLRGITESEFIHKDSDGSIYNKFSASIARIVNTSIDNVEVFSIRSIDDDTTDVRFAAHGSPYYSPVWLNGLVLANKDKLEFELGVDIMMVGIDECLIEGDSCESSCYNSLEYSERPYLVQSNHSSLVTVYTHVQAVCECKPVYTETRCSNDYCFNGGTCFMQDARLKCNCPHGFDGPRCEQISAGFDGKGFAWFSSLHTCNDSTLTITFSTQNDGLLLYNGPIGSLDDATNKDFIALEIIEDRLEFYLNLGDNNTYMLSSVPDIELKDGSDHSLVLNWTPEKLVIGFLDDECLEKDCDSLYQIPNNAMKRVLNVNTPLQIGGMSFNPKLIRQHYESFPRQMSFKGCVSNVTFNEHTIDFSAPAYSKNMEAPCSIVALGYVEVAASNSFIIIIVVCVLLLLALVVLLLVYRRKRYVVDGPDDDIRGNIISYEDEGGGEKDTGYDISVLRVTPDGKPYGYPGSMEAGPMVTHAPLNTANDIEDFLTEHKDLADKTDDMGPEDVRHYAYEGMGSDAGSLSSLSSGSSEHDQDWNYLAQLGPRFQKLADMYGGGESDSEPDYIGQESIC